MNRNKTSRSTTPLRVIQVGAGGMGQTWLQTITESADVELVGIVDLDLDAARASAVSAGKPDLLVATSLTEAITGATVDAVINVTVPGAHHPVTTEALFLGLPVLGEKPVASNVAQALSLAAAAEVTGNLFMVSQSRRYDNQFLDFRQRVRSLGTLGSVTTEFFKAPHFGGFRDVMPFPLLLDMAIHPFDCVRSLLGTDPVSVYCDSYNPDWSWYQGDAAVVATFEMENGVRYVYNGSWCSPGLETSWNAQWRVSGANGSAQWDGDNPPTSETVGDGSLAGPAAATAIDEGIAGALGEFVDALRNGSVPQGEVHSNIMSLAMVEAAVESASGQRRVRIDDVLERAYQTALAEENNDHVKARLTSWTSVHDALRSTTSA